MGFESWQWRWRRYGRRNISCGRYGCPGHHRHPIYADYAQHFRHSGAHDATLINSDNSAALLLTQAISTADLDEAYSNLGVIVPQNAQYTMTVATYAGFFRVLYNATYLSHDDSEHVLGILSQTTFNDGLVAGVPSGVVVSHKFGERGFGNSDPNQLHDCGIVYAKNPYVLCVMTQGQNYNTLAAAIATISKMVYAYAGP